MGFKKSVEFYVLFVNNMLYQQPVLAGQCSQRTETSNDSSLACTVGTVCRTETTAVAPKAREMNAASQEPKQVLHVGLFGFITVQPCRNCRSATAGSGPGSLSGALAPFTPHLFLTHTNSARNMLFDGPIGLV